MTYSTHSSLADHNFYACLDLYISSMIGHKVSNQRSYANEVDALKKTKVKNYAYEKWHHSAEGRVHMQMRWWRKGAKG